jgi:GT2 family glycosyltransferase
VTQPIRVVRQGSPYGAAVVSAATSDPSGWLILGEPGVEPREDGQSEQRLSDLLLGGFGIEAVVPGGSGTTTAGAAQPVADVTVASTDVLAVRAAAVASTSIEPECDDSAVVVATVLAHLTRAGKRVVCDPGWDAGQCAVNAEPSDAHLHRILVVTGALESRSVNQERRAVWELIESLSELPRVGRVTVVTAERAFDPGALISLRRRGVETYEGPIDWQEWFTARAGSFSLIVVTPTGLHSSARNWVDKTQPGALKVVFWSRLPSSEVRALGPITRADDESGLELVGSSTAGMISALGRWCDAMWHESPGDAGDLSSLVPSKPLFCVPAALTATSETAAMAPRSGMAVVAVEGYDVLAGNEDSAIRVLDVLLEQVRWRASELDCTVVSDRPTPMLEDTARSSGATIVPSAELERVISSSRILVAAHEYGTGQPVVLRQALAAGTPIVATPYAVGNLDLGGTRQLAVFESEPDLVARICQLLSSEDHRAAHAAAGRALLAERYCPEARSIALIRALAYAGIDAGRPEDRWPYEEPPRHVCAWRHSERLDLRPGGMPEFPRWTGWEPKGERERYQLWVERVGPTPEVLRSIRLEIQNLKYRPRISILLPVYNTDGRLLIDAIDSVRAQIYRNWQLCIADDGSDRAETREVLTSLAGDPSIVVIELGGSSGISAATNAALTLADGDYVTFLDHDDLLKPHALAQVARWLDGDPTLDVIYSDEDKLDPEGQLYDPHLKPDWSPDLLTTQNYLCHLTVARRSLVEEVGGFRSEYDGSQDYDLFLRLTERTRRIAHIPEPLYSWRAVPGSAAAEADAKPYAIVAARRAVADALDRRGYEARVDTTSKLGCFRARYPLPGQPKVSIIIPSKNRGRLLRRCITSITERSTYHNFEIVVIDNQSTEAEALGYLATGPARVIRYSEPFNYARMMNFAARSVECDALLFLNNDTEVINPDWIEALLEHAMRPEVGAVGGRLFFGDGEPQHEGIMLAVGGGWAYNVNHAGYWARGELTRNTTAVTGACTMTRPSVYWRVGGNDERLRIAYNDVDLCLRIRHAGYEIVYTPFAELFHYESASRSGYEHPLDGPLFGTRWRPRDSVDPYYSPLLSERQPFKIKI